MPYIPQEERVTYDPHLRAIIDCLANLPEEQLAGHLNYCISKICFTLFDRRRKYVRSNTIKGALDSAKDEFTRRKVAPYEDEKMKSAGDI